MTRAPTAIPWIAQQHVDDAAFLAVLRLRLAHARHVGLRELSRFDERLAAHLGGIEATDETGWRFCVAGLGDVSVGTLFTATAHALQSRDPEKLASCLRIAETESESRAGLFSAFGWSSHRLLHGTVMELLNAREPFRRAVGVTACAMHGVEPAPTLSRWLTDEDPLVRMRAVKATVMLGRSESVRELSARANEDDDTRFWTACSSVLLGDRGGSLEILSGGEFKSPLYRRRARAVTLQALSGPDARKYLRDLGAVLTKAEAISLVGIAGDPVYGSWLIEQMGETENARTAAEAFALLTGVRIDTHELSGQPPTVFQSGPNDDPDDPNVDMDPDDGLPWPDATKVEAWWHANGGRFQKGTRYFMGQPVTKEHCIHVLKTGYQRQRILAAQYLCLLEPGTPLFNTAAPAWRQQRLLAAM